MGEILDMHQTCISSGIDWLTATFSGGARQHLIHGATKRWIDRRVKEGYARTTTPRLGYVGEGSEGIWCGTRHDGTLVVLSGQMARENANYVASLATNITRLDLQLTLLDPNATYDWSDYAIKSAGRDQRIKAGQTHTTQIRSTPTGRTAYLGSRASERFFRAYDKAAESKGSYPAGSWRWEVEYKGDRAERVAAILKGDLDLPEKVRSLIVQAYADYRVTVPCDTLPAGWRDTSPRHDTTDERRLEWLNVSIKPMVERLLESQDPWIVLAALGLGAYIPPETPDKE